MSQKRLIFLTGGLALLLLLSAGCAKQAAETPAPVKLYSNDGLLGLTDANPNLPLSPSYHTYTVDQRMVLSVLKQVKGISNAKVVINGPQLYIYLKLPKGMDEATKEQVQVAAFNAVCLNMPRYRVNVIVGQNKLSDQG